MASLIIVIPPFPYQAFEPQNSAGNVYRPRLQMYNRLLPYREVISKETTRLLASNYTPEICNYLRKEETCEPAIYSGPSFWKEVSSDKPIDSYLDELGVNLIYAEGLLLKDLTGNPQLNKLILEPEALSWETVARSEFRDEQWLLLKKSENRSVTNTPNPSSTSQAEQRQRLQEIFGR